MNKPASALSPWHQMKSYKDVMIQSSDSQMPKGFEMVSRYSNLGIHLLLE